MEEKRGEKVIFPAKNIKHTCMLKKAEQLYWQNSHPCWWK